MKQNASRIALTAKFFVIYTQAKVLRSLVQLFSVRPWAKCYPTQHYGVKPSKNDFVTQILQARTFILNEIT